MFVDAKSCQHFEIKLYVHGERKGRKSLKLSSQNWSGLLKKCGKKNVGCIGRKGQAGSRRGAPLQSIS